MCAQKNSGKYAAGTIESRDQMAICRQCILMPSASLLFTLYVVWWRPDDGFAAFCFASFFILNF